MFNVLADRLWATAIQAEKTTVSRDKIVVRIQGLLTHRYPTFHQPVLQRAAIVLSPPPVALRVGRHPWGRPWQTTRTPGIGAKPPGSDSCLRLPRPRVGRLRALRAYGS